MSGVFKNIFNPTRSILNPLNSPAAKLAQGFEKKVQRATGLPGPLTLQRSFENKVEKQYLGGG